MLSIIRQLNAAMSQVAFGNTMSLALATIVFNFALAGLIGLTLYFYYRRPGWTRFLIALAALLAIIPTMSELIAAPCLLRTARMMCFGLFAQLPLFLVGVILLSRGCPWLRRTALFGILAVVTITVDCFLVEPFRLEVTRVSLKSEKLDRPLRVALVTDFQTDHFGAYERQSLRTLMQQRPDVIVMAGDYLQSNTQAGWEQLRQKMNQYLREIGFSAPLGIYAVGGNTDFQRWPEIFEGLPVAILRDTQTVENDVLAVTGLAVEDSFRTDLGVSRRDKFHITLGHAPNFALGPVSADLLAAGHTHGGQVQLPFLGPIVTLSAVPRKWAHGVTRLDEHRTLAVARGIGMERRDAPRIRFLCRPQLIVLDFEPAGTQRIVQRVAPSETR